MYTHTTFNLNPRAVLDRHAAAQLRPGKHVDHMHPNAIISIAASKRCDELTKEIFGGEMAYVPWMRPGFELGLAMQEICREESEGQRDHDGPARLHLLGRRRQGMLHRDAALHREGRRLHRGEIRGQGRRRDGVRRRKISVARRRKSATRSFAAILPWLRGQVSQQKRFIGTVQDDEKILRFVNSKDAAAPRRTRHELPRPFPAHEDQAALRRLESADRRPRGAEEASSADGLEQYRKDYAAVLREVQTRQLARDARPEPDGRAHPRPRHGRVGQGQVANRA